MDGTPEPDVVQAEMRRRLGLVPVPEPVARVTLGKRHGQPGNPVRKTDDIGHLERFAAHGLHRVPDERLYFTNLDGHVDLARSFLPCEHLTQDSQCLPEHGAGESCRGASPVSPGPQFGSGRALHGQTCPGICRPPGMGRRGPPCERCHDEGAEVSIELVGGNHHAGSGLPNLAPAGRAQVDQEDVPATNHRYRQRHSSRVEPRRGWLVEQSTLAHLAHAACGLRPARPRRQARADHHGATPHLELDVFLETRPPR